MPLMSLWRAEPKAVNQMSIEQIVATAGDGKLLDGSECQQELRDYLAEVSFEQLGAYAAYCLDNSFGKGGQTLQDIVNELGRRLDYTVTNGRYAGSRTDIGFDGLWRDPGGHDLVVEVKTTDAYRITLDTLDGYRSRLLAAGEISDPNSILIVVGRADTGELEAQVRGSRHAWHIRLISIDSLLNLVRVKQSADSEETVRKIRQVLTPVEYTRLDALVDIMFTATKDVETAVASEATEPRETSVSSADGATPQGSWDFTPSDVLQAKRDVIVEAMSKRLGEPLVRKTRATYWSSTRDSRIICTLSKRYKSRGSRVYWYAYHPAWDEFLDEAEGAHLVLGCMDQTVAYALPVAVLRENLGMMRKTEKPDGTYYWHLDINEEDGAYYLFLPDSESNLALSNYAVPL